MESTELRKDFVAERLPKITKKTSFFWMLAGLVAMACPSFFVCFWRDPSIVPTTNNFGSIKVNIVLTWSCPPWKKIYLLTGWPGNREVCMPTSILKRSSLATSSTSAPKPSGLTNWGFSYSSSWSKAEKNQGFPRVARPFATFVKAGKGRGPGARQQAATPQRPGLLSDHVGRDPTTVIDPVLAQHTREC